MFASVFALTSGAGAARSDEPVSASSTEPVASAGCGAPVTVPGESTVPFSAAGKTGTYIQNMPAAAAAHQPMPVVIDLHGYLEPARIEHIQTGLGRFGDSHGFVTITPQLNVPRLPQWDYSQGSTEISYLADLLAHVETTLCVDRRRVFMTGLSMGGFTTSSVACQLADRIAAVAPVAGLQNFPWCKPSRPVPVVAFHGTDDPIIAYTGGVGESGRLLPAPEGPGLEPHSIPDQVAGWAERNDCGPQPTHQQLAADVTLLTYPCPTGNTVEFYSITGGGHTWPGSTAGVAPEVFVGATTTSIDANQIMWDFFQAHPLTGPIRP